MTPAARWRAFSLAVGAAALWHLLRTVPPAHLPALARAADPRGLLTFLAMALAALVLRAWRYRVLLEAAGHRVGGPALLLATLVRGMCVDLLPARTGSLAYVWVAAARLGVPAGAAASSFVLAVAFDLLALAPLLVLAALLPGAGPGADPRLVAGFGALAAAGAVALLLGLPPAARLAAGLVRRAALPGPDRAARWGEALLAAGEDVRRARRSRVWLRALALSLLVRAFSYGSLAALLFGVLAPFGYQLASIALPQAFAGLVAGGLPLPGAAGPEGAWGAVFAALALPPLLSRTAAASLAGLLLAAGAALGLAALLLLQLRRFAAPPAPAGAPAAAPRFWGALGALCVAVPVLAAAAYKLAPAAPLRFVQADAVPPTQTQPAPSKGRAPVRGWVVYTRPDGIYKTRVESGETLRLADLGSYPRWSPDGTQIAFLRGPKVMLMRADGSGQRALAETSTPACVAFHPDGAHVLYADGEALRQVAIADGAVQTLAEGRIFREPDLTLDGRLVFSTKEGLGRYVRAIDLKTGRSWRVAVGCSASLSPDGSLVTVNGEDHRRLFLWTWDGSTLAGQVSAPRGLLFDNQFWSNDPDWIASVSQGGYQEVMIHSVSRDEAWRVTFSGAADRPDLFVTARGPAAPGGDGGH